MSYEEIKPRALKPSLLELDGISRATIEAHYKLYQGYVNKRNEILRRLAEVDLTAANQGYSDIRPTPAALEAAVKAGRDSRRPVGIAGQEDHRGVVAGLGVEVDLGHRGLLQVVRRLVGSASVAGVR